MSIDRREIYRGRAIRLTLEEVTLPNGNRTALEVVRHPGAAAVVPFVTADEILIVRQYRHAAGGYLLEVPAGKLDHGEPPEDCARRETDEEVGHLPGRLERLGAILTTPGFSDEVIHLFAAYDLVPTALRHERDEVMSVERVRFEEALALVERGEIRDAKSVCALLLAARRRTAG
jgi:ADP-ribose pyrophosphatase